MDYQIISVLVLIILIITFKKNNWFQNAKNNKFVQIGLIMLLGFAFLVSILYFKLEANKIIKVIALLFLLIFSSFSFYSKYLQKKIILRKNFV